MANRYITSLGRAAVEMAQFEGVQNVITMLQQVDENLKELQGRMNQSKSNFDGAVQGGPTQVYAEFHQISVKNIQAMIQVLEAEMTELNVFLAHVKGQR